MDTTRADPPPDDDLWTAYMADHADVHRNAIFDFHWPAARLLAVRWIQKHSLQRHSDDLIAGLACDLLEDSIPAFSPQAGRCFGALLKKAVEWSLIQAYRRLENVSAYRQRLEKTIHRAQAALEQQLGRAATEGEIAAKLGISERRLTGFLGEASHHPREHIVRDGPKHSTRRAHGLRRDYVLSARPLDAEFHCLTEGLEPQMRDALWLCYIDRRPIAEVAMMLGVTRHKAMRLARLGRNILQEQHRALA